MTDIERYVEMLFSNYKNTKEIQEIRDEVLANLQARIDDEISEGKSYQDAFESAIKDLGDVETLINGHPPTAPNNTSIRGGVIALIFAALSVVIPLLGLVLGIIGVWFSRRTVKQLTIAPRLAKMSSVALIVSIIGIVIQFSEIIGTINFYTN